MAGKDNDYPRNMLYLFSGLCTIADAMTTALGVSSNLAFETNPMVAWRVVNPALFITFEVGWFFITVAAFQFFNRMRRDYNIRSGRKSSPTLSAIRARFCVVILK